MTVYIKTDHTPTMQTISLQGQAGSAVIELDSMFKSQGPLTQEQHIMTNVAKSVSLCRQPGEKQKAPYHPYNNFPFCKNDQEISENVIEQIFGKS